MSMNRDRLGSRSNDNHDALPSQGAPGKRTRTEGLQARDFADRAFDQAHSGEDYYEARATVEPQSTPDTRPKLSGNKLVRAMRKNPRWMALYPEAPRLLSEFRPDTDEFALDVAAKQRDKNLEIDGIAGPKTLEALLGSIPKRTRPPGAPASRSGGRRRGSAPSAEQVPPASSGGGGDRFVSEDPFASHLLEDPGADVADLGHDDYEIPDMTGLED